MEIKLPMFGNMDIQEVAVDYRDVVCLYNVRNYFALNSKLREIERKYRAWLLVFNAFRPVSYLSLYEQAWECMSFLTCIALSIEFARGFAGKSVKEKIFG